MIYLEVKFLGGASEVGRSAILLKDSKNIMLDYGIKLDEKIQYPLPAGKVDAAVLSHAHLDHSGALPVLYNNGNPICFGTEPTFELSKLLLEDSMKIARKEHIHQKFNKQNYLAYQHKFFKYNYGSRITFGDYYITLYDAGHITGSSITLIENMKTERRLVYTGDFKLSPQLLQAGAEVVESDILVIESTYGSKEHPDREKLMKKFIDDVKETLDNGGTALVPAFAVGRAQELLALLYKNGLIDRTFLDGMAKKATEIVMKYPKFTRNESMLVKAIKHAIWIEGMSDRRMALQEPGVIVTTAGMLTGGPVLNYLPKLNENSKIFLTGFQIPDTNGHRLMHGKPVIIDGEKYKIPQPVDFYDFSAHAGMEDLTEYIKKSNPETIMCVHGDSANTKHLAETLKMEGFDAHAPHIGDSIKVKF